MKTSRNLALLILLTSILGQSVQAQSWTPQAKGTVIGAGTGAAVGAIINKRNRAVGGVIGGVIGGAGGYAIGKQGKRRWSPQAKGTAIGAGVGGAAGAIINKRNRVVGGVIGGVAGGAAGYAIGKIKDNKNKEAARIAAANRAEAERNAAARAAGQTRDPDSKPAVAATSVGGATSIKEPSVVQPVAMLAAHPNTSAAMISAGYLENETYGDPSAPYGTSEYRRKSW